jgi:hypothetical protein
MRSNRQRILVAICVGLAAVFIIMWPRSYRSGDSWRLRLPYNRAIHVESKVGQFEMAILRLDNLAPMQRTVEWYSGYVRGDPCRLAKNWMGCDYYCHDGFFGLVVPHWLIIALVTAPAGLIWIRGEEPFRFGLRTLFLAVTFVALLLGLMMVSS